MAKISIDDHMDDLLERLMSEDISAEDLEKTVKISKVVTGIAKVKLDQEKNKMEMFNSLYNAGFVPTELSNELLGNLQIENKN